MRVALDAMGGDHAPREIIRGVAEGLRYLLDQDEMLVFGPQDVVARELTELGVSDPRIKLIHCTQIIEMDDPPVEALRQKRDSTIARMAVAAAKGEVDAIISAGNTGAFVAACQLKIGTIAGVSRPGIAVVMPTFRGPAVICDVGANVAPKAHQLHEYARMSAIYAERVLGIAKPRVGLMSIGEEEAKGNTLVKEARALMRDDPTIDFVGNLEGRDVFVGQGDVFICDGFVGNIILKLTEGLAEGLFKTIIREIQDESAELARAFKPIVERIWTKHDFAEYGGAPLLGINSIAIICHGRSDRRAIANAVRVAAEQHRVRLNQIIAERMSTHDEVSA